MGARGASAVGVCMVVAAFVGGFAAQAILGGRTAHAQEPRRGQVRARAFVLEDEEGKTLATLAAGDWGHGLLVRDAQGKSRMVLGMLPADQVGMVITSADQKTELAVGAWETTNHIDIYDGEERPRFTVGIDRAQGNGGLAFYDVEKNERLAIGMGPGGGGDFVAKDQFGNDIWRALAPIGPPALP